MLIDFERSDHKGAHHNAEAVITLKSDRETKGRRAWCNCSGDTETEQLSSDREREFRDAEGKVEGRTVVETEILNIRLGGDHGSA